MVEQLDVKALMHCDFLPFIGQRKMKHHEDATSKITLPLKDHSIKNSHFVLQFRVISYSRASQLQKTKMEIRCETG